MEGHSLHNWINEDRGMYYRVWDLDLKDSLLLIEKSCLSRCGRGFSFAI